MDDTGRHAIRPPKLSPPGGFSLDVEDIEDTRIRHWAKGVESRLDCIEEVNTSLRAMKWIAGITLGVALVFVGWLVRTTIVTETKVDELDRRATGMGQLTSSVAEIRSDVSHLRYQVQRIEHRLDKQQQ